MKHIINSYLTIFVACFMLLSLHSCSDDNDDNEVAKPQITLEELGLENSLSVVAGNDLHVEAEIVAEGKIANINVEIHKADGDSAIVNENFSDYNGLKNCDFHKHLDIPENAETGTYHFHLTVIDQNGNSTTVEEEHLSITK